MAVIGDCGNEKENNTNAVLGSIHRPMHDDLRGVIRWQFHLAASGEIMKEYPVTCHCGSPAHLRENSLLYNGRSYGNGKAYICDRFPDCHGSVGVHPNGKPLGTIPDEETKKLRMAVHAKIDPLWRNQSGKSKHHARGSVYGWLRHIMGLTPEECHIGNFTAAQCRQALEQMEVQPYEIRA